MVHSEVGFGELLYLCVSIRNTQQQQRCPLTLTTQYFSNPPTPRSTSGGTWISQSTLGSSRHLRSTSVGSTGWVTRSKGPRQPLVLRRSTTCSRGPLVTNKS